MLFSREELNSYVDKSARKAMKCSIEHAVVSLVSSLVLMHLASLLKSEMLLEFGISFMVYIPCSLIHCIFIHLYLYLPANNKKLYTIDILQATSYIICGIIALSVYVNSDILRFLTCTIMYFSLGLLKMPSILSSCKEDRSFRKTLKQLSRFAVYNESN